MVCWRQFLAGSWFLVNQMQLLTGYLGWSKEFRICFWDSQEKGPMNSKTAVYNLCRQIMWHIQHNNTGNAKLCSNCLNRAPDHQQIREFQYKVFSFLTLPFKQASDSLLELKKCLYRKTISQHLILFEQHARTIILPLYANWRLPTV